MNSFLTGGGARKADADLWSQAKKSKASKKSKKEERYKKLAIIANKRNKYKFGLSQTIPEKDTKILMVKIGGGNSMKCMMQC